MASTQSQPAAAPVRTNWAGNYSFSSQRVTAPESAQAVQALVAKAGRLKAVGTRHSFNAIADTTEAQVDLSRLRSMSLDTAARTVTVGAGVTYGQLAPWLDGQGFALHNLASLPHISVVGACATGTHGSGLANGCLSTAVRALHLVTAGDEELAISRDADAATFSLAAVHLGAMGVVTAVTLDVVPTFQVAQMVYEGLPFEALERDLPVIFAAGYSVSLFTDWQGHRATQAWVKRKVSEGGEERFPEEFFGASRQRAKLHPLPGISAESCTEQMGEPGAWYDRLPHFRLDYTPSAGAELQTEYFVALADAVPALRAIEALRDRITPHLLISELRTVAADELAMSMAYRRDSLALHFTWKQEPAAVMAVLPAIEAALRPFAARPHWAKLFTVPGEELRALYPQGERFLQWVRASDPHGRFQNAFLEQCFGQRG